MMFATVSTLFLGASAATLKVEWTDCGDADTHAKVTDLSPTTIVTGSPQTLTGTGTLDKTINGATFSAVIKAAGVKVASCSGDASADVVCKLPLGVGSITVKAIDFPMAAGTTSLETEISLSSLIPASFASASSHISATSDTGDKLVCLDVNTEKQATFADGADVDDLWRPYAVRYQEFLLVPGMDETDQSMAVWYPLGAASQRFPFISYAHGFTEGGLPLRVMYGDLLQELASYGYIVAAPAACNLGCSDHATRPLDPVGFRNFYLQQLRAIDWAKSKAAAGDALFSGANFDLGVGVAGHSMGGQATLYSASTSGTGHDIRAAVMHHAFTHSFPAPVVPFMAMTGRLDVIAPPSMAQGIYNASGSHPEKAYVNKLASDHFEVNPGLSYNKDLARFTAAWFKIYLDQTPQESNVDWEDMIFGSGNNSLCHGGDGTMVQCKTHRAAMAVLV